MSAILFLLALSAVAALALGSRGHVMLLMLVLLAPVGCGSLREATIASNAATTFATEVHDQLEARHKAEADLAVVRAESFEDGTAKLDALEEKWAPIWAGYDGARSVLLIAHATIQAAIALEAAGQSHDPAEVEAALLAIAGAVSQIKAVVTAAASMGGG